MRSWRDNEDGTTILEILVSAVVLVVGILGLMQFLINAFATTAANEARQQQTNLAREVLESAQDLAYNQITSGQLPAVLRPKIPGSSVNGGALAITRGGTTSTVTLSACSMDDPSDGYGVRSSPPVAGGVWCSNASGSATTDSDPDDYRRLTVTVTPGGRYASQEVTQTTLIRSTVSNGPAIACLRASGACPGSDQTLTSPTASSVTFTVTTPVLVSNIRWLVNGSIPPSSQRSGGNDPYSPTGTTSTFTWNFTGLPDGAYTVTALAADSAGRWGPASTLQITLNRRTALPPAAPLGAGNCGSAGSAPVCAGYNETAAGADVIWSPSVDQDVLYYRVYRQLGTGSPVLVCQTDPTSLATNPLTSTISCFDSSAPVPSLTAMPKTCNDPPQSYATTANNYWVVAVDSDPTSGQPREGAPSATSNANLCNHAPKAPNNAQSSVTNGVFTMTWSVPDSAGNTDTNDSFVYWRIYRRSFTAGGNPVIPGDRYDTIDARASGATGLCNTTTPANCVLSFTDLDTNPGGVQQRYCVTAVDRLGSEGVCSAVRSS